MQASAKSRMKSRQCKRTLKNCHQLDFLQEPSQGPALAYFTNIRLGNTVAHLTKKKVL